MTCLIDTGVLLRAFSLVVGLSIAPATIRAQQIGLKQPSFDSAGIPIHYIVRGPADGEAVVLIHGFAIEMETMWTPVMAALQGDFKVIALDCRGHGGSGKPHDSKKYGVEMIHDVARLLDHLGIDKAHVVGYSMGAGISLGFAIHYPDRVRTVVVGGGGGGKAGLEKLILALAESLEKGQGLGPIIIGVIPQGRPQPPPEAIKAIDAAVSWSNDMRALAAVARSFVDNQDMPPSEEQIKGVRVPVLALIGADDPLRAGADQLKKLLPAAKVVVIDKADHVTAFTRAEFISSLRHFLDENRRSPAK